MIAGGWLGGARRPPWWSRVEQGGGQVVEQATHLDDLARYRVGEAEVVRAVSVRDRGSPAGAQERNVADATATVLRFDTGAVGAFATAHRPASSPIEVELGSQGRLTTLAKADGGQGDWHVSIIVGSPTVTLRAVRDHDVI